MLRARLIPVSGIGSEVEAEQRAASAFLAVLSVVRDLSIELLSPLGASRAQRAVVEAYTEVVYNVDGKRVRPDGLLRVAYGTNAWSALVEVTTGQGLLTAEQVNTYWDLAKNNKIDHVLTISNEIASAPGMHPTAGLKVRSTSKVSVSHLSWARVLAAAIRIRDHKGVSDPEQAWILSELIRYLEHPSSGALAFDDMGPAWVGVRDGARIGALNPRTEGVGDIAARWDQLLQYVGLKLSSEIGSDVSLVISNQTKDPKQRHASVVESICATGQLMGALRVPNTAGDLDVVADLRAQSVTVAVDLGAPQDRGARARVSWLVGQLKDAPASLTVEAFPKNVRIPAAALLSELIDDKSAVLDAAKRDPNRFRLVLRSTMGLARKSGTKQGSFIDSVVKSVGVFYGAVLQNIAPWQAAAPKLLAQPIDADPVPERVIIKAKALVGVVRPSAEG